MLPLQLGNLEAIVADPLSIVLLVFGALFIGAAMLVMGYLSIGGVLSVLAPE